MLHSNRDWDLTNVRVSSKPAHTTTKTEVQAEGKGGRSTRGPTKSTVLKTTARHPFWDATTKKWVDAADLVPGKSTLVGPNGERRYVTGVKTIAGAKVMRDLTVADIHTYYVLAGAMPVLVHNCNSIALGLREEGDLRDFADKNGHTHFLDDSRDDALANVREVAHMQPSTRIHIVLDGFRMSNGKRGTLQNVFEDFYKEGRVGGNWITTQREMNIVGESVRRGDRSWDSITFWHEGVDVTRNLRMPDFGALRSG
jgi:hypothetical protein